MKVQKCSTCHSEMLLKIPQVQSDLARKNVCTFDNCEYRALTLSNLNAHIKNKHMPGRTRDFQCALCPGSFYSIGQLQMHIRRHLREKPFKCNSCNFNIHTQGSLRRNRKSKHEKLRRKVKCSFPGCNYSAFIDKRLKKHQKTHETDPDHRVSAGFPCRFPHCSYRATRRRNLERHIWARHNPDCLYLTLYSSRSATRSFLHVQPTYTHSIAYRHTFIYQSTYCCNLRSNNININV